MASEPSTSCTPHGEAELVGQGDMQAEWLYPFPRLIGPGEFSHTASVFLDPKYPTSSSACDRDGPDNGLFLGDVWVGRSDDGVA